MTGAPTEAVIQIRFESGAWVDLERIDETARALVAGPEATDNPTGTVVLAAGRNGYDLRVTDSPEVVVTSGVINVSR